jgi:hypothetical protein
MWPTILQKKICTHTSTNSDANTNFKSYLNLRAEGYYPKIVFKIITSKEIEKVIASFPSKNSAGYDEISVKTLKISAPFISSPLCYIFNKAILYGKFPSCMKYSFIIPIHKSGDKKKCGNYRPISLLTSFSKIFEKLIFKRISTHVLNYDILANEQFGFRPKLSTEVASYTLINKVLTDINNKKKVGAIFFDLEKAFDCVNHEILLYKLKFYGLTDNIFIITFISSRSLSEGVI